MSIEGVLVESQGSKQKVELQASKLLLVRKAFMYSWFLAWYRNFLCWLLAFLQDLCYRVELIFLGDWLDDIVQIGGSDAATFPVQKKRLSREYLRSIAHLRPRTNTFSAVCTCL